MPITTAPYNCPTSNISVVVVRDTFRVPGGIGADGFIQDDFSCTHESQCMHRYSQACVVFRLASAASGA